jgi:hypothetical protein
MDAMIHIGADAKSVRRVTEAINDILGSDACDQVQLAALDTLKSACQVTGTTIQNCTLTSSPEITSKKKGKK